MARLCSKAGCKNVTNNPSGRCEEHELAKRPRRVRDEFDFRAQGFYRSMPWRRLSEAYRAHNPLCEHCDKMGIVKKADVVDHIVELKDDYERRLDVDNLQSLCHSCHNMKTGREKSRRNRERNNNGFKGLGDY